MGYHYVDYATLKEGQSNFASDHYETSSALTCYDPVQQTVTTLFFSVSRVTFFEKPHQTSLHTNIHNYGVSSQFNAKIKLPENEITCDITHAATTEFQTCEV